MTLFLYFRQKNQTGSKCILTVLNFTQVTSVVPSVIMFANLINLKQNTTAELVFFARYFSSSFANVVAHFMTTYRTLVTYNEF